MEHPWLISAQETCSPYRELVRNGSSDAHVCQIFHSIETQDGLVQDVDTDRHTQLDPERVASSNRCSILLSNKLLDHAHWELRFSGISIIVANLAASQTPLSNPIQSNRFQPSSICPRSHIIQCKIRSISSIKSFRVITHAKIKMQNTPTSCNYQARPCNQMLKVHAGMHALFKIASCHYQAGGLSSSEVTPRLLHRHHH